MSELEQIRKELNELRERVANMERNQPQYKPGNVPFYQWPTVIPPVQYPSTMPIPHWVYPVTCENTK